MVDLPASAVVAAIALAALWPFLLLPIGSPRWSDADAEKLVMPAVLGTRRVSLARLDQVGGFRILGRGGDLFVLSLRDADGHRALLARSGQDEIPAAVRAAIQGLHQSQPSAVSARVQARLRLDPRPSWWHRVLLGSFTSLGFLAYIGMFFVFFMALTALAGVLI